MADLPIEQEWDEIQNSIKHKIIENDDVLWNIDSLQYVGGVDVSFLPSNPSVAVAALIVLDFQTLSIVYQDTLQTTITEPYISGYLAFRELIPIKKLLDRLVADNSTLSPNVILVDGNGILHSRGCGLACHIGVITGFPTIGVSKTLLHLDGLSTQNIRNQFKSAEKMVPLIGSSGRIWGAALISASNTINPIFISVGHRISLKFGVAIVEKCCRFRIPEPLRMADKISRAVCRDIDQL